MIEAVKAAQQAKALGADHIINYREDRFEGVVRKLTKKRGVDVVFAAAGGTGVGVYQAAKDAGKLAIGVDSNQNHLHPGTMLTSMVKRVDLAVYDAFKGVKPGVTGWAQVRYTYGASVEDAIQKLQYDLYYIKNMSIALDIVIVLETIKTVVLRRGAR